MKNSSNDYRFWFSKMFSFGTLSYTAPEIIEENEYDRKADVYSFGIVEPIFKKLLIL